MKKIGQVLALLRVNWRTMAGFEILYKIVSWTIFTPLFWGIFNVILNVTGYQYLTKENILSFLCSPLTLLALVLLFVCMAVYTMIDIGAVIFLLDQSAQGKRVHLTQTLRFALPNGLRVFQRKNILVAFVVLFLIPFLNLGVAPGYVSSISVPEFILDFICGYWYLLLPFIMLLVGMSVLLLRWLYAFHYFSLEGCSFREARRKSAALSRNHKGKDLLVLFGVQMTVAVLYFLLIFAGGLLAVGLASLMTRWEWFGIVSSSVVWVFIAVSFLVMSALAVPFSYACISILFYQHKMECGEEMVHVQASPDRGGKGRRRVIHLLEGVSLAVSVACCSFYFYCVYNHKIEIQVEYAHTMEVTAHRGASRDYPENTMAAFAGAKELGADWVELDVQQSRDGEIFVMHDTSFMRTTGVGKHAWELDYEEIRKLDAGSFFGPEFAGEHIPLLKEVIDYARDSGLKLNIEMKPSGHETDFEKKVADLIAEEQFWNQCVVTSQVYEVLEKIKSCDERIETVYVMSLAYGEINQLTAADHFSIEATSITEKLVASVHGAGKQLYAWTVNTEENINRMIELNVDHIITDDVTLAKECIYLSKTSDFMTEYIKMLQD